MMNYSENTYVVKGGAGRILRNFLKMSFELLTFIKLAVLHMRCFQQESIYIHKTRLLFDACIVYSYNKTSNAFFWQKSCFGTLQLMCIAGYCLNLSFNGIMRQSEDRGFESY